MKLTRVLMLAAAVIAVLAGCAGNGGVDTDSSGIYNPGTYSASAKGISEVTVEVTVDADSITAVKLDLSGETEAIGQAAVESLVKQIMDAQSSEIDGVSGASATSSAVQLALSRALSKAAVAGPSAKMPVADGTYSATASGFSWTGQVTCDVTFTDNAITDIKVVEEYETFTGEWFYTVLDKYIPRILENQSLEVDAVTGATFSSNAVRDCVADAIEQAGGASSDWYTEIEKSNEVIDLMGYDVVVVGLGGSGILSYCSAASEGASVFGIEAAAKLGGDSACTYGPMALNSEYLKNLYNDGKDYINEDDVYETWIDYVENDGKPEVIKKAVYESGSALDFFVEKFSFAFEGLGGMLGSFVKPEWNKLWCVYTADNDNTSWNVLGPNKTYQFDRAMNIAKGLNDKNDFMLELTAEKLITDKSGKVTGVQCSSYDGTKYNIYGKSVIIATGGFIGNDHMMNEYLGSTVNTLGVTVNNGAGIRMAQEVGGALMNMDVLPMIHISQVKNMIKNNDLNPNQKAILSALALTTDQLSVTTEGKIWGNTDESGTQDEALNVEICFAPGYQYYVVYTAEEIAEIAQTGLRDSFAKATSMFMGQGGEFATGVPVTDIYDILSVGESYGNVIKADGIAGLAAAIGCDSDELSRSLKGEDTEYYAVITAGYAYATVGGLDIDENMNVLKEDGSVIENLFAVGQDSEGVTNASGKAYTPWAGQAQSWTFVSGKIAGEKAAEFASVNK